MIFSNFRVNIILRILLLVVLLIAALYSIYIRGWIITPVVLFVSVCITIFELIYYVEKTNKEFSDFLLSVKNADFSKHNIVDKRGKSFSEFKKALNIIVEEFQTARIDKEANYVFLQTIVEHLNTAIIAFDATGEIKLINKAAQTLLHTPYLRNIYALKQVDIKLCEYLTSLQVGNNPIFEVNIKGEKLKLLARSTDFRLQGVEHKLISVQNIKTEIEHTELEAWEQLLHVLTHEIMNSITPISSLSATLKMKMDEMLVQQYFDADTAGDMSQGLQVIANRSDGLVNFVSHYKNLIALIEPHFGEITVKELFDRVRLLTQSHLQQKGISLLINARNAQAIIKLDIDLIEQVLLNLVNNAADALTSVQEPSITLSADLVNDKIIIRVADNGQGVGEEVLSKIFIPFFTTKKNGSGIGLSLSKQIMRIHNGSVNVVSIAGKGSVFALEFPLTA